MKWGYFGEEPPCEHLLNLRAVLEQTGMEVWSEHGEQPSGWVNVYCGRCHRTYETVLREPWDDDRSDN